MSFLHFIKSHTSPLKLQKLGILGMNARNHNYIGKYNCRSRYPLVDNKLKTKTIAQKFGATVPELIGVIERQAEVETIHKMVEKYPSFVIKPAQGSGGKGILVVTSHRDGLYTKSSGAIITKEDIQRHISNALSGLFSLGGRNDVVLIEDMIKFDDCFDGFSYEGVPDIRIIVFKGFPIMAMMRCSTIASDGKANLHQGAVGVGLDIATGRAIKAVQFDKEVRCHPDTSKDLLSLEVLNWKKLLQLASSSYEMTKLGYIGADIVLDKQKGPMLLELNARPGLSIQIANGAGLIPRLKKIEQLGVKAQNFTQEERIAYSIEQFGLKI